MLPTTWENKKEILLDLVNQLSGEINNIFHAIEEDPNIPLSDYRNYEKMIATMNYYLHEIETEVYYS